mmetsp:Transcript_4038/g.13142  ORF Transcript_4038/g.13142 Transcript_4038/m.13142 type:complete len:335 (+) Transcript_4038:866-1870(+)
MGEWREQQLYRLVGTQAGQHGRQGVGVKEAGHRRGEEELTRVVRRAWSLGVEGGGNEGGSVAGRVLLWPVVKGGTANCGDLLPHGLADRLGPREGGKCRPDEGQHLVEVLQTRVCEVGRDRVHGHLVDLFVGAGRQRGDERTATQRGRQRPRSFAGEEFVGVQDGCGERELLQRWKGKEEDEAARLGDGQQADAQAAQVGGREGGVLVGAEARQRRQRGRRLREVAKGGVEEGHGRVDGLSADGSDDKVGRSIVKGDKGVHGGGKVVQGSFSNGRGSQRHVGKCLPCTGGKTTGRRCSATRRKLYGTLEPPAVVQSVLCVFRSDRRNFRLYRRR